MEQKKFVLNIGKGRKTIQQSNPEDYDVFEDIEDAVNEALGPDRIVIVTISHRPYKSGETSEGVTPLQFQHTPNVPPVMRSIDDIDPPKECAICNRVNGQELFSVQMRRFVHQNCVEDELMKPEVSPAMRMVAKELGIADPA